MGTIEDVTLHAGFLLLFKFMGASGALAAFSALIYYFICLSTSILMIIQIHIVVSKRNPLRFSIQVVYALTTHQRERRYHDFCCTIKIHLVLRWTKEACFSFLDNLSACANILMTIPMASKEISPRIRAII